MPLEPPVVSPTRLADAYTLLAEGPITPIAGGTDLMVALNGELGEPPDRLLDIWHLHELRGIAVEGDALTLGALTTFAEIRRSAQCREHLPALVDAAATIGAAQIQNRGTLGGNVVNASPAGDTLPVLLALDASLVCGSIRGERTVPATAFWPAYRQSALAPDELLLRIRFPLAAGRDMRFRKVGTRRAQSISKVMGAAAITLDGTTVVSARVALGAVADRPIRITAVETAVRGLPLAQAAEAARQALRGAISPIDDLRSTSAYRREVAENLVARFFSMS